MFLKDFSQLLKMDFFLLEMKKKVDRKIFKQQVRTFSQIIFLLLQFPIYQNVQRD